MGVPRSSDAGLGGGRGVGGGARLGGLLACTPRCQPPQSLALSDTPILPPHPPTTHTHPPTTHTHPPPIPTHHPHPPAASPLPPASVPAQRAQQGAATRGEGRLLRRQGGAAWPRWATPPAWGPRGAGQRGPRHSPTPRWGHARAPCQQRGGRVRERAVGGGGGGGGGHHTAGQTPHAAPMSAPAAVQPPHPPTTHKHPHTRMRQHWPEARQLSLQLPVGPLWATHISHLKRRGGGEGCRPSLLLLLLRGRALRAPHPPCCCCCGSGGGLLPHSLSGRGGELLLGARGGVDNPHKAPERGGGVGVGVGGWVGSWAPASNHEHQHHQ